MEGLFKNLRGVRSLHIAKLLTDTVEELTYDTPVKFAGVKSVGNEPEEASATEYYDNQAAIITDSEGADKYGITCSVLEDEVRALIEGRKFNKETGEFMATPTKKPYIALGFIGKDTNNIEYVYWILKGKLAGGGEKYNTTDSGTDSTNLEYEMTSIYPTHTFTKADNETLKFYKLPLAKVKETEWFSVVTTPENVKLVEATPPVE